MALAFCEHHSRDPCKPHAAPYKVIRYIAAFRQIGAKIMHGLFDRKAPAPFCPSSPVVGFNLMVDHLALPRAVPLGEGGLPPIRLYVGWSFDLNHLTREAFSGY